MYYLQRENRSETVIPSQAILTFDTSIALSETAILTPSEDFQYHEDGTIDILRQGTYLVLWFVAGMTGMATNGQSYQLKRLHDTGNPYWETLAGSGSFVKVSSTPGFALVVVSEEDISTDYGKVTIGLFNTADSAVQLTLFPPKASILIYGFDLDSLNKRLEAIEEQILDLYEIIRIIEDFIHLSDVIEVWSLTTQLLGLGTGIISSGYTFNFWGIGALNHQQTLTNGTRYNLILSSQFPELLFYQGDTTIGTLWIETPTGNVYSLPIRFDATGIYFTPMTQLTNLPIGTTFKFTQALILVET